MDFDFTDDQQQLRDAVHKWVEKGYGFERRRAVHRCLGEGRGRDGASGAAALGSGAA